MVPVVGGSSPLIHPVAIGTPLRADARCGEIPIGRCFFVKGEGPFHTFPRSGGQRTEFAAVSFFVPGTAWNVGLRPARGPRNRTSRFTFVARRPATPPRRSASGACDSGAPVSDRHRGQRPRNTRRQRAPSRGPATRMVNGRSPAPATAPHCEETVGSLAPCGGDAGVNTGAPRRHRRRTGLHVHSNRRAAHVATRARGEGDAYVRRRCSIRNSGATRGRSVRLPR